MKSRIYRYLGVLFAALAPMVSYAYTVNTTSTGAEIKWFIRSAGFYINSSSGPTGTSTALQWAMATWSVVPGATFLFNYSGTTSRTGGTYDNYNVLSFGNLGSGGTIAQNSCWYYDNTGEILESDVVFNTYYTWSVSGEAGKMDLQNIATHELGHALSLEDLYGTGDKEKTMYGYATTGETKKSSLDADDIAGIVHIYPFIPPPHWMLNVTLSGGSGSVNPVVGLYTMPLGSSTTVVATADDWYRIQSLTTNGTPVAAAAEKKVYTHSVASMATNKTNTVNVTFTDATPVLVGGSVSNATLFTYAKNHGYGNNESGAAADANLFYDWLLGIDPRAGPYTPGLTITAMAITNTDLTIVMQLTTNAVPKNTQINGWLQIQGSTNVGGLYTNIVSAQLPQAVFSGNGEARIHFPGVVTPRHFYKAQIHSTP
jgi:hypothetical protein